jgi:excisionase family DNA binding protein
MNSKTVSEIPQSLRDELTLLTPAQVAELLAVTTGWVYDHAAKGTLPSVKIGNNVRVRADQLRAYIRGEWTPAP